MTITTDPAPADHEGPPKAPAVSAVPHVDGGSAAEVGSEAAAADELVADDEVLLEEISIDGMCGVY